MNDMRRESLTGQTVELRERLSATTLLHGLLFALAVLAVALAALVSARHFEPKVDAQVLDGRMAQDFEHHYDQSFPARGFGISLWAAIDYLLFDEAQTGVVAGRDGWLYTDEEFNVVDGAERVVEHNLALVDRVRDALAAKNVQLVVAVVPAKARVYPEHLRAGHLPPALHRGLYDHAQAALVAAEVAHPDLFDPLEAGKARAPTFLRTDTHWTPFGARLAARSVAASVRQELPAPATRSAYTTTVQPTREHRGDLFNFLPLEPYFGWLLPRADTITPTQTTADAGGDLFGASAAPRIALVGTSYSANPNWNFVGALEQQLGEDIANYAKDGEGPFVPMDRYLHGGDFAAAPPQLVIWEIPERYLAMPQKDTTLAAPAAAH
ncbi:alginate O-acetyltransferase [Solimonas soli]|uniref:alginate O-acetyltransferase n=1 Tax=Solimonas soli TaxID=413479 RepID=UPI0004B977EA|nr:alginate O-acetyltransferase [Solimonas soli]